MRFGWNIQKALKMFNQSRSIIDNPDTTNHQENLYRKEILSMHRGFERNEGLFKGFPSSIQWIEVVVTKDDLQKMKYIKHSYWNELSSGTRFVVAGAKNVLLGKEVLGQSNEGFYEAFELLKRGHMFNKLILVCAGKNSPLVLLEGHLRSTVYCMQLDYVPEKLNAIVGFSKDIKKWGLY